MKDTKELVRERVKEYYWDKDINCARTTLLILGERFGLNLEDQVLDAAAGLHGAGFYGAQCGLVEGGLMFLGLIGRQRGISEDEVVQACYKFASQFEERFSSLLCRVLRPEGFHPDNPPHLCEGLTNRAICFSIEFVEGVLT